MRRITAFLIAIAALALWTPVPAGSFVVPAASVNRVDIVDTAASARDVIARRVPAAMAAELALVHDGSAGAPRAFRFRQMHNGIPVIARGAGLVAGEDGIVALVTAYIETRLPDAVEPAISRETAAAVAGGRSRLPANPENARLVIWPGAGGGVLAWVVAPANLLPVPYAPIVVVDAANGRVIYFENMVRFKNLWKGYEFNPISTPNLIDITLPIPDPNNVPKNDLVDSFNCVDTHTTKRVNAFGFDADVHVCELLKNAIADQTNGDYLQYGSMTHAEPSRGEDDPFGQLSVFYHVAKAYDWFKAFDPAFLLHEQARPIFVVASFMLPAGAMDFDLVKMGDPNLPLEPLSNAMYTGWDPQFGPIISTVYPEITGAMLIMGQGANADFSYDGDVIYHEFGHAVVDSTIQLHGAWHMDTQGSTVSPGGMNEGLSDYFSSAIAGDGDQGEYAGSDFGMGAIRHLDNNKTCPEWLTGEVHADGEFFSAPLWKARQALPEGNRGTFDGAVFATLQAAASGDVGYEDLAAAFVAAVKGSVLGQAAADDLQAKFEAAGVLPTCHRVFVWKGNPIASKDVNVGFGFTVPGISTSLIAGNITYMPSLFQVEVPVPENAFSITATFVEAGGGGSFNPFGPSGTPFAPALLVKLEAEIAFDYSNGFAANTTTLADMYKNAQGDWEGKVGIPKGTAKAYVMVVNKGDQSGGMTNLVFSFQVSQPQDGGTDTGAPDTGGEADVGTPDTGTPDTGTPDGGEPDAGTTPDTGSPPADTGVAPVADAGGGGAEPTGADEETGGCSCAVLGLKTGT
ncbi:MAG: hypothetical protein HY897_20400 [Deltaproteobacteria bacterium]|nr:hypothetical protein [Deltaproteobacteria bacterium]